MNRLKYQSCCDPFSVNCTKRTTLRNVNSKIASKTFDVCRKVIKNSMKICGWCYNRISRSEQFDRERSISPELDGEIQQREDLITPAVFFNVEKFNFFLEEVGKERLDVARIQLSVLYKQQKFAEICEFLKKEVFEISSSENDSCNQCGVIIDQLKTKFDNVTTNAEKVRLLTVLPPSWTYTSIINEFGASRRIVHLAKSTALTKGACSEPDQKLKKQFDPDKKQAIARFFQSPEISYVLPGEILLLKLEIKFLLIFEFKFQAKTTVKQSQLMASKRKCKNS
jgi:hypothetical protein